MTQVTAEQKARDLLERLGVEGAQSFSAGEIVELANLIADHEKLQQRSTGLMRGRDVSEKLDVVFGENALLVIEQKVRVKVFKDNTAAVLLYEIWKDGSGKKFLQKYCLQNDGAWKLLLEGAGIYDVYSRITKIDEVQCETEDIMSLND